MKIRSLFAAVVVIALVVGTVALCVAQDEATIDIDVVFSATKTEKDADELTTSTTVIDEDEIDASESNNLTDVLEDVPSLNIVRSGTPGGQVSIFSRGGESNHTLFLVDGVKINLPTVGQADIADYSLDGVARIESVAGPMGTLYGSEAMTGVVQVFTAPGWEIENSVEAGYGTDGLGRLSFSWGRGEGDEGLALSGSYDQHNDFYKGNDDYERTSLAGRWDTDLAGGNLTWTARYFDSEKGMPGQPELAFDPNDRLDKDALITGLAWNRHGPSTHQRLQLGYFDTTTKDNNPANSTAPGASDQITNIDASIESAEFQQDWYHGDSIYTIGAEYRDRKADFSYVAPAWATNNTYDKSNDNKAAFGQIQTGWGDCNLVGGLRWEDNEQFGSDTNYRVGINRFCEAGNMRVWANYGTSFRAPTLTELYYPNSGNTNLEPEESKGWEFGLGTAPDQDTQASLAYFRNEFDNIIDFDPATWTNVNAGKATTHGYEFALSGPLSDRWSHRMAITKLSYWTRSGDPLLRRPEWTLRETFRYQSDETTARVTARYIGARTDNTFQPPYMAEEFGGYFVVDVGASHQISDAGTEVWLRANNLFDSDFQPVAGYPDPGLTIIAGVRMPH